ncbi:MAG: protein kinase [Leptolyngbyaceae cyanobacterium bins.302]|nr:protein kinase [Leptolyngbyaceae cyanobacterium bins.302]
MIAPLPPGTVVFNRYRVVGLAGQGEFGLTYLAQDQKRFEELCLLREFSPLQSEPAAMERLRQYFHQAAALLYELQHPQLPRYQIMFAHGDRLYLVRDYIVGKSCNALLNERHAEGRTFSQAEVMQLLFQTLPILTDLHRLGIVHENLAPQSIVIQREEQVPVLIDFGLVKRLVMQLQLHPVPPDTPIARSAYAAPEHERAGSAHPSGDIFSLGAIAVALLLGKEPQDSAQRWLRTSNWEVETGVQPDFARVLKRMLHPNPQKRFTSTQQVLRALEPIAGMLSPFDASIARMPVVAAPPAQPQAPIAQSDQSSYAQFSSEPPPSSSSPIPHPPSPIPQSPHPPLRSVAQPAPIPQSSPRLRPHSSRRKSSKSSPRPKADLKASAILVVSVALLVSVVSFRALSWVQTEPDKTPSPANTIASPTSSGANPAPSPQEAPAPSPQMPTREGPAQAEAGTGEPTDPAAGRSSSTIDAGFLSDLTDELFYAKHPDLAGQKLGDDQKDLQNEWNAISNDVTSKLNNLSPQVLSKLGRYERGDYDRWTAPGSGASLNSRELNVLVNNRFAELFPEQKGKSLNPKTFGQVWYALAEEELNKLKPAN